MTKHMFRNVCLFVLLLSMFVSALVLTSCGGTTEDGTQTDASTDTETEGNETVADGKESETATPVKPVVKTTYDPAYKVINTSKTDLSIGTFVATFDVSEYGVDMTGAKDCTSTVQKLIDKTANLGGGVIYFPDGVYKFTKGITLRKGVTLRGEWVKPVKGQPIEGTVFAIYYGKDKAIGATPFIQMETDAGVMDVAIFYPEQNPNEIVQYSPAIKMGVDGFWGNEYNNVKNVTFVNAYIGVHYSYTNGGASPVVNGVYGSPLYMGIEVDNIADVGRVEYLDLSPEYWIGCGLYERLGLENPFKNEAAKKAVRDYIYDHGIGLIMRRNDWSYSSYLTIEGYNKGYAALTSIGSKGNSPNGHNYCYQLTNCKIGIAIEASNYCGNMFDDIRMTGCDIGIWIAPGTSDVAQFTDCSIDANTAIKIEDSSLTKVLVNQCVIKRGEVVANGGILNISDCDFKNTTAAANINIGPFGSANIIGNRFDGVKKIVNQSMFSVNINDDPLANSATVPHFEYGTFGAQTKLPAKMDLFLVTDYGAKNDRTKTDNTEAFQKALNAASANGGGIVFVPAGYWRLDGTLTIPEGVELRGATDTSTTPHGEGTVLETYWGKNRSGAEAFISIKSKGGLRGFTIDYPEQVWDQLDGEPDSYPWAVRGCGDDLYIINVAFRACYAAVDLLTNKCDRFYIDYVTGHMFNYGLQVGGGSKDGVMNNVMCNTIAYACGNESKFGSFPNSPKGSIDPVYTYGYNNLEFLTLADTENLSMYNCFNFGSNKGIILTTDSDKGPTGVSIGLGLDADVKALYITEDVSTTFTFINTQFVSLGSSDVYYIYSEGNNDFEVNLFASDYWGAPHYAIHMPAGSGVLRCVGAHFQNPGEKAFLELEGGETHIIGSNIGSKDLVKKGTNGQNFIVIEASIADAKSFKTTDSNWVNNIGTSRSFSSDNDTLTSIDRSGWTATASSNSGSAKYAFDGKLSTRWDTAKVQEPGMFFQIDFGEELDFDTVVIDVSTSTSDMAVKWKVFVSSDGKNWGEAVASGERGSGIIRFEPVSGKQYLRIEQEGSSQGNYWSIHEIYVCDISN